MWHHRSSLLAGAAPLFDLPRILVTCVPPLPHSRFRWIVLREGMLRKGSHVQDFVFFRTLFGVGRRRGRTNRRRALLGFAQQYIPSSISFVSNAFVSCSRFISACLGTFPFCYSSVFVVVSSLLGIFFWLHSNSSRSFSLPSLGAPTFIPQCYNSLKNKLFICTMCRAFTVYAEGTTGTPQIACKFTYSSFVQDCRKSI